MNTLAEIEAVLPTLSPEELAQIEAVLHRLRHERQVDARFDGRAWPSTSQEVKAILAELDALPPLLAPDEAEKFDAWRVAERERQRALSQNGSERVRQLFS